uniref:CSON007053 protein n=1 Tax=Culicoides sonorensis TaxID=179676 RepID=A0A336MZM2_CULSO
MSFKFSFDHNVCSLCWQKGVNYVDGVQLLAMKKFFDYCNFLINYNTYQVCDLCIEKINNSFVQYVNLKGLESSVPGNQKMFVEFLPQKPVNKLIDNPGKFTGSSSSSTSSEEENKEEKCDVCNKMTYDLDDHMQHEHPKTYKIEMDTQISNKCPICEENFEEVFELSKHVFVEHPKFYLFKCKLCDFKARKQQSLTAHMKHHGAIQKESDSKEKDRGKFTEATPSPLKGNKCPECGEIFKGYNLNRHMNECHPGIYLFSCDSCGFKTNFGQTMAAHKRNNHSVEMKIQKMFED